MELHSSHSRRFTSTISTLVTTITSLIAISVTKKKASRTLCRIVAISESGPSTPADWDEYAVDEDLQEAMYQAANEFQGADGGTGVVSDNDTVVWNISYIDSSHRIDGRISCAAHFRCHLPIASGSYLCAIHTEHAARSISANLLRSVVP
jgi:hypothetical protein